MSALPPFRCKFETTDSDLDHNILRMATNAEYIQKVRLFECLDREKVEAFADVCTRRHMQKGEILFIEGEPSDTLYVIVSGRLRIERIAESGAGQVLAIRGPGEVIGEMGLIDGQPRSAQAVAQTKVKLLCLGRENFRTQVLAEPSVCFALMQTLSHRIRESAQLLLDTRSKTVHERLLDHLQSLADPEGWVNLGQTQAALSEELGCTREAVNRAFSYLEAEQKIERLRRQLVRIL